MKVLKNSIIAKLIIKKHKRDVENIFSVVKNIKKINSHIPTYLSFSKSQQIPLYNSYLWIPKYVPIKITLK